jgi:hypothetical protein
MPTLDISNIQSASLETLDGAEVREFERRSTFDGSGRPYPETRKRLKGKIRPRRLWEKVKGQDQTPEIVGKG